MLCARPNRHSPSRRVDGRIEGKIHHRAGDHNMQQAIRVADTTAFFSVDISEGSRTGYLVEIGETPQIFGHPREKLTRDYISGQFS